MDYNAWFEAYLGGKWYVFDARHNVPRIGRILVARGRDAADIPMIHTFGPHALQRFEIVTEEVLPTVSAVGPLPSEHSLISNAAARAAQG